MLIRFGVKNHLSIRDYQELSCVASNAHDDLNHTIIVVDAKGTRGHEFLPVIALYGANAAGKSNMLDAFNFFRGSILRSFSDWKERKSIPHYPFQLDEMYRESESQYDCDVLIDRVRYTYGFSLNREKILKEWLFAYPKGAKNILFQRDFTENVPDVPNTYFGATFRGINESWRSIGENQKTLFLSAAGNLKHDQLTPVYNYFKEKFRAIHVSHNRHEDSLAQIIRENKIEKKLAEVLNKADFGIVGIDIIQTPIDEETKALQRGIVKLMSELSSGTEIDLDESADRLSIKFIHSCVEGKPFSLDYSSESTGTKYLLNLLVPVIAALEHGGVLIVDEITTSLHTKLSEIIVRLFTSSDVNKTNAQFIFSTHDTNLLSRDLLRRDEILFAEKNKYGVTEIYPLTDFKTRKADNIEKGYLQGRFGAIPFIGDVSELLR